jgi:MFS transporter, YNFM family, putative membrane transport protein
MALAVNASTLDMAVASLGVAFFNQRIDRRRGIIISLTLLAIPTLLLAFAPKLAVFATLRTAQGLCMASAFTLALAYLGERCSARDTAGTFAAYIAGMWHRGAYRSRRRKRFVFGVLFCRGTHWDCGAWLDL